MTAQDREYHTHRIISGCTICSIYNLRGNPTKLLLKSPGRFFRYLAEEVFRETLEQSYLDGLKTEEETLDLIVNEGLWSAEKEEKLKTLPKDLEDLKVKMYSLSFKSDERRVVKKLCKTVKSDIKALQEEKASYFHISAVGAAAVAKARYLVAMSLFSLSGERFFSEENYWLSSGHVVDEVMETLSVIRLEEEEYRELARNDPWRTIWSVRKSESGLFGVDTVDLTEEQKVLCVWSNIYDNIYSHPECPSDSIIEDDDLLDGWMIIQRRKRDKDIEGNVVDSLIKNEKIKNADEVFIPASDNKEDREKIENLNDDISRMTKRQRMAYIQKHGRVAEAELPDVRMKLQSQKIDLFKDKFKKD